MDSSSFLTMLQNLSEQKSDSDESAEEEESVEDSSSSEEEEEEEESSNVIARPLSDLSSMLESLQSNDDDSSSLMSRAAKTAQDSLKKKIKRLDAKRKKREAYRFVRLAPGVERLRHYDEWPMDTLPTSEEVIKAANDEPDDTNVRYHCDECNYDLCEACYDDTDPDCPKGHALQRRCDMKGWYCDGQAKACTQRPTDVQLILQRSKSKNGTLHTRFRVGTHPYHPDVRTIGIVGKILTPKLLEVRFPIVRQRFRDKKRAISLILEREEIEDAPDAREMSLHSLPLRLSESIRFPVYTLGSYERTQVLGMRGDFDANNLSITLKIAASSNMQFHCILGELEPMQSKSLSWPMNHIKIGDYMRFRALDRPIKYGVGNLIDLTRTARVVGDKDGMIVLNFRYHANLCCAPEDVELSPFQPTLGASVRVSNLCAPLEPPRRQSAVWPPGVGPRTRGVVKELHSSGVVTVSFDGNIQEYDVADLSPWTPAPQQEQDAPEETSTVRADPIKPTVSDGASDDETLCPITTMPIDEPVVAADGETYEREAFETYCRKLKDDGKPLVSPMTNTPLESEKVYPNRALIRKSKR